MIISVNWLKKFTDIDLPIDVLATRIGERLVEIESVEDLGAKYKDVLVVRVVECQPLEGSDHLNVTKVDDGGVSEGVERDESGLIQVVCGAPNVRAGMLAAWLAPGTIVPETYGSAEPIVLAAKPLRGVVSNGMLASARELALYDEHDGILEIDKDAAPGSSFAELYELNDYLLDIENKSLTHRPDTFGVIGFAREVAGIQGKQFVCPDWLGSLEPSFAVESSDVTVPHIEIEGTDLSERFTLLALNGVDESARSPLELQTYLARSGVRPINAAVDVSNYLMLLTGQPSHMYDYDKLKAVMGDDSTVRVRLARADETLELLDGRVVQLDSSDIVIAAGDTAVGLAGIMGGARTKVDDTTRTVLLEVATFDLYHMRSSQMRHGIFSEAVTRYTKGIPAPLAAPVASEAARLLGEYAGAQVASELADAYPSGYRAVEVTVGEAQVNGVLGTQFAAEDIAAILENVGFAVSFEGLEARVTVPYWRNDIHIPEDIIEEVGRLAGFDTISLTLPRRDFVATAPSAFDVFRAGLRNTLARAGANEVLTYSFVHGDLLRRAGQDPDNSYRIVNSISPDLQYYRQSIVPSLLSHVHANSKAGYDSFALFEGNLVHGKNHGLTDESVPVEAHHLGFVLADIRAAGDAYYQAKAFLEYVANRYGIVPTFIVLDESEDSITRPFEPQRSAWVVDAKTGIRLGVIGEFRGPVRKAFKLPEYTAGFELYTEAVHEAAMAAGQRYQALSRYPGTERDVCFKVASSIAYDQVYDAAVSALTDSNLITSVEPSDIYRADTDSATKNITIRLKLASYDETLTSDRVTEVVERVIQAVTDKTGGEIV